jgi:ammonium transporter, Amt family
MENLESLRVSIDSIWIATAAAFVFFMNIGFALLESGSVQEKNVVNVLTKNIAVYALCLLVYWSLGFAIEFAEGTIAGSKGFFLLGADNSPTIGAKYDGVYQSLGGLAIPLALKFLFQAGFASTCATIISGAVAERIKLVDFLLFTIFFIPFGYAVAAHWVWGGGWLFQLGFFDFAGSTMVHAVGGLAALIGVMMLGPRRGRYESPKDFAGHSATSRVLGCGILWLCWWFFNGGSVGGANPTVAHILLTTNLSAASGGIAAFSYTWQRRNRPDLGALIDGILGGLVGVTGSCAYVAPWASVLIGLVSGLVVVSFADYLDKRRIDDPVHAIATHLGCGIWGTIAVGLFSQGTAFGMASAPAIGLLVGGSGKQLGVQIVGLLAIMAFTGATSLVVWSILKFTLGLRVSGSAEAMGLDLAYHRERAYPLPRVEEHLIK